MEWVPSSNPFQNEVQGLEMYKMEQAARIQSLMEDNSKLKRTINNNGLTTPPPTLYPASLQVILTPNISYLLNLSWEG